ncbi:MAG TPA: hypothetical protein VFG75_04555 [Gaiella sp.]|nr:hypothetical protein [Gaiella sp.]
MAGMSDRRNALMWAIGWWLVRGYLRRRTTRAVAGMAAGASRRRRGISAVLGAFALVAVLAGAFVAWRRLSGGSDDEGWQPPPDDSFPPAPTPEPEAIAV